MSLRFSAWIATAGSVVSFVALALLLPGRCILHGSCLSSASSLVISLDGERIYLPTFLAPSFLASLQSPGALTAPYKKMEATARPKKACSVKRRRRLVPPGGRGRAWGISSRSVCATCMVTANRRRGGGGGYTCSAVAATREFIGVIHGRQAVHSGLHHTSDSSYIPHACRCCGHREWPAC